MSEPKTLDLKVTRAIRIPMVPNFIQSADGNEKWRLAEFSGDDLNQIIEAWSDALEAKALEQRQAPRGPDALLQEGE